MRKGVALLCVVLLVLSCANPVAAVDQQFDDIEEELDIPISQNVVWVADPDCTSGNPLGACAQVQVAAAAISEGYVVFNRIVYLVLGAGTIAAVVEVSSNSPSQDHQLLDINAMGNGFKESVSAGLLWLKKSGTFVWKTELPEQNQNIALYTSESEEYSRFLNQLEKDYNDSKEKGLPTKNNKDQFGHGINNKKEDIGPYMSVRLFKNKVDEDNGCPIQIRYYGKDGKPEEDIDFWGGNPEGHLFPHRHGWRHDLIAQGVKDDKLTRPNLELGEVFKELWELSKCKYYDYENHKFKRKDL